MNRSDRLYELIRILRDGRMHRATDMAKRLQVSDRTIYRDMDVLMASGVPVAGERGIGYRMTAPVTLPPLNLTLTELEALHLGLAVVGQADDDDLKEAAGSLSSKIDAVLPADRSAPGAGFGFSVYPFAEAAAGFRHLPAIRSAIRARQKLRIAETDRANDTDASTIRALALEYWGRIWTVTCWCETRNTFRVIRADRIDTLTLLPALFVEEQGKTLIDYRNLSAG